MKTLWLKLSEEVSLPEGLSKDLQEKLVHLFDLGVKNSPWVRALTELGLKAPADHAQMLSFRSGTAYINGTLLVSVASGGWVEPIQSADGFGYQSSPNWLRLPALLKAQWRLERFLDHALSSKDLLTGDDAITRSLALGLAMQSLMLRLPKHEPRELAKWLADGGRSAPASVRDVVKRMQEIQLKRTELSRAWQVLFPTGSVSTQKEAPTFYWSGGDSKDDVSALKAVGQPSLEHKSPYTWNGLPVFHGRVRGRPVLVDLTSNEMPSVSAADPVVYVFAKARPQAVEYYEGASALVFAEGGLLAHACVVARERGIPSVTGVGRSFIVAMRENPGCWILVDGSEGTVTLNHDSNVSG